VSNREIVMMTGLLNGMNREEPCLVGAVKVTLPGTNVSHLARYSIQNAPTDLPDGQYQLTFNGETTTVKRRDGHWLTGESWV
jgi:hypothetical protein